jgi:inorganic pyrophosphatase
MKNNDQFWKDMEHLLQNGSITIDRPMHSAHPHFPEMIYPLDYGYLENTMSSDGDGIDVWLGSMNNKTLTGILCTFDKLDRDAEIKFLLGCSPTDITRILNFYDETMSVLYIPNPLETIEKFSI